MSRDMNQTEQHDDTKDVRDQPIIKKPKRSGVRTPLMKQANPNDDLTYYD